MSKYERTVESDTKKEKFVNSKRKFGKRKNKERSQSEDRSRNGTSIQDREIRRDIDRGDCGNDPHWYAVSEALLRDSASFPYSQATGTSYNLYPTSAIGVQTMDDAYVPGICELEYYPTPGISRDNSSPVNIAARNIFSFVRHANNGHSNYESPDLMMYLLAMDSIYSMWAWLVRIYGIARTYSQKNRYFPLTVLKVMGLDPDSIIGSLADLHYFIDSVACKVGAMCVPTTMPLFLRHMWLNTHIWLDQPGEKAQIYIFNPTGYYVWKEGTSPNPGYLQFNQLKQSAPIDYPMLRYIMESMINGVMLSQDFNIMSGDIYKAYAGKVWKLESIPADYTVIPEYSEEVLSQIENAEAIGDTEFFHNPSVPDLDIVQDPVTGAVIYDPTYDWRPGATFDRILNLHVDEPTPADTMVATRLKWIAGDIDVDTNDGSFKVESAGSEIVRVIRYVRMTDGQGNISSGRMWMSLSVGDNATGVTILSNLLGNVPSFRHFPIMYLFRETTTNPTWKQHKLSFVSTDWDNYTIVGSNLTNMHETALLSEFAVPMMGSTLK